MVTYIKIPINYSKLPDNDKSYMATATLKLTAPLNFKAETDPRIHKGCRDLEQAIASYEAAKQAKPVVDLPSLKVLDKLRDQAQRDLYSHIDVQTRSRQAAKKDAALKLQKRLEPFKRIGRLSHSEQSNQTIQLLKLCDDREVRALLKVIAAEDLVAELKDSQDKFEQTHLKKMEGKSQKTGNIKRQKLEEMLRIYKTLYRYLYTLEEFGLDSYHRPILAAFNDVRQTFLEKQKKKAKKKEATVEEPLALLEEPKETAED